MEAQGIIVAVLAHNEERRIAACLASLPSGHSEIAVHALVNGSQDRTAEIARSFSGVTVHDWPEGGKARSWNRFVLDTPDLAATCFVFVDGDAAVLPGSIEALCAALAADGELNAAAAMPQNGRRASRYRAEMLRDHGLFGDLYALSGEFVGRMRRSAIRLPEDLVGDDGLIGALAKTDLAGEHDWRDERVLPCPGAGFLCEPTHLSWRSLRNQYRRMISYSLRHFQNRIITAIMRGPGPGALPKRMAELYAEWLPRFRPRRRIQHWWFDRQALARMRRDR